MTTLISGQKILQKSLTTKMSEGGATDISAASNLQSMQTITLEFRDLKLAFERWSTNELQSQSRTSEFNCKLNSNQLKIN